MRTPILIAAALLVAACRGDEGGGAAPAAAAPGAAAPSPASESAPPPPPPAAMSVEDSILAAREDSIHEAELFKQRSAQMESYESCMAKARRLEPPEVRAPIIAACGRSRGAH